MSPEPELAVESGILSEKQTVLTGQDLMIAEETEEAIFESLC